MNARNEPAILDLCNRIREIAYDLHLYLGRGHLEKVYPNGLAHRLRKANLRADRQFPIRVRDADGTFLGDYFADCLVEGCLFAELKACRMLTDDHIAQVLGYLRGSGIRDALLMNFGSPKMQIRKFIL